MARGLFFTATGTGVGKTYVAALAARTLVASGFRVGVYKPVASGCRWDGRGAVSRDAEILWGAAGRPGHLDAVCPQRFAAPLAPHLAARAEGKEVDPERLLAGIDYWRGRSDVIIVEGAGGLMSPVSDALYNADLAADFGYPLIVVADNALGTINATLQTLIAARTFRKTIEVAGVVLNQTHSDADDPSVITNRAELEKRCQPPVIASVRWKATATDDAVDWYTLSRS